MRTPSKNNEIDITFMFKNFWLFMYNFHFDQDVKISQLSPKNTLQWSFWNEVWNVDHSLYFLFQDIAYCITTWFY